MSYNKILQRVLELCLLYCSYMTVECCTAMRCWKALSITLYGNGSDRGRAVCRGARLPAGRPPICGQTGLGRRRWVPCRSAAGGLRGGVARRGHDWHPCVVSRRRGSGVGGRHARMHRRGTSLRTGHCLSKLQTCTLGVLKYCAGLVPEAKVS